LIPTFDPCNSLQNRLINLTERLAALIEQADRPIHTAGSLNCASGTIDEYPTTVNYRYARQQPVPDH